MRLVRAAGHRRGGVGEGVLIPPPLLDRIARAVGTPVYVYDAAVVRERYRVLSAALAGIPHRIFYSVKANSSLAILGIIRALGGGADIVSVGELVRAKRAGFAAPDIVFSGVGKRPDELAAALDAAVALIHVESSAEFHTLAALATARSRTVPAGIRVNPDVTTHTHPFTQTGQKGMKFGVPLDEVEPLAEWAAREPGVTLVSIGMHIGSQILDAAHYRAGAARLADLVERLRARGITTLTSVDVGGGLGVRYLDERPLDPEEFVAAVRPLAEATGLPLAVEPGRYLVGPAGMLLTRCLYRKCSGGRHFVIVDAGMSDFVRPSLYGAAHDVRVVDGAGGTDAGDEPVDVVGPICETGDVLARGRTLPDAAPGALLAILGTGAYGFSMSSTYNSRPRPAEVLVDGGRWAVIRQREVLEDLMRGERTLDAITDWVSA